MKPKILILYHQFDFPLRSTVRDLLYCYKKYSDAECIYLNTAGRTQIPSTYFEIEYDLIVFQTVFISLRWGGMPEYLKVKNLLSPLLNSKAYKIVLPQDEWIHLDILNQFINDFKIDAVYTVAPESEWPKIYSEIDRSKVSFHYILTGYIDNDIVNFVNQKQALSRSIDIGYRAYKAPAWLGRHGFLKTDIADVFNQLAPSKGLKTDISTQAKDTIIGDAWYDFLLSCKYFIGLEGGSTVIDPLGDIWIKGNAYVKEHPNATFEEIEQNVFPGMDGNLQLIAISPRHLECCITRTCQILMEGNYNGILQAGRHYIELKKDYSNIEEVLNTLSDETRRLNIVENAYNDIVASGKYNYNAFVAFVLKTSIGYTEFKDQEHKTELTEKFQKMEELYNSTLTKRQKLSARLEFLRILYKKSGLRSIIKKIKSS